MSTKNECTQTYRQIDRHTHSLYLSARGCSGIVFAVIVIVHDVPLLLLLFVAVVVFVGVVLSSSSLWLSVVFLLLSPKLNCSLVCLASCVLLFYLGMHGKHTVSLTLKQTQPVISDRVYALTNRESDISTYSQPASQSLL